MAKRVGAKSIGAINQTTRKALNEGVLESASLSEALSIDFSHLMICTFPRMNAQTIEQMHHAQSQGITKRMQLAASLLSSQLGSEAFAALSHHQSDTVRGWAAYALASDAALSLEQKLSGVKALADDPHFCVREWAWLALRPSISLDIRHSIELFTPWVNDASENIRRFAIEATRPRGVWSKHIAELKDSPQLGEPLLNRVMEDTSRYVQNSCANWLNDAGKTQPLWVTGFCKQWQNRSQSEALTYVARRALRNIE
ncbi:MAG: DNA alkylation repair protein [Mariprofundaceae bacterium]